MLKWESGRELTRIQIIIINEIASNADWKAASFRRLFPVSTIFFCFVEIWNNLTDSLKWLKFEAIENNLFSI